MTGGGTGGHLTPLTAIAHEIKQLDPGIEVVAITETAGKFSHILKNCPDIDAIITIRAGKFRRYHGQSMASQAFDIKTLSLNTRDFFKTISGLGQARRVLKKLKPQVVFAKGGYVSLPVGLAAHWLKIPLVTHDSDTMPGLANNILGRYSAKRLTGMPLELYKLTEPRRAKYQFVGIPVNLGFTDQAVDTALAKAKLGLNSRQSTVLFTSGSQGAVNVNHIIAIIAPHLLSAHPDLVIFHQTGQQWTPQKHDRWHQAAYIDKMPLYMSAADIVVTRASATTLAELSALAKPAIVIPSPVLAGGHQLANAEYFQSLDAVVYLKEAVLQDQPELLQHAVEQLLSNRSDRQSLSDNLAKAFPPNAGRQVASILVKYC